MQTPKQFATAALNYRGTLPWLVALVAIAALGAGVVYGAIPDEDGIIHGCYQNQTGTLRVIESASETCRGSETALTWNQEGQPGADGATWHTGEGVPDEALGADDDLYLDTEAGDVYVKADGEWDLSMNIIGPKGPQGEQGPPGPAGASDGYLAEGFASPLPDGFGTITSLSVPAGSFIVSASMSVSIGPDADETFFTCFLQFEDDDGSSRGAEAIADLEAGGPNARRSLAMTDGGSLSSDGTIELKCQDVTSDAGTSGGSVLLGHLTAVEVGTLTEQ